MILPYFSKKILNRAILVFAAVTLVASSPTWALRPEWNSYGWLLINAEHSEGRMYTGYWSIVGGVETWLYKYYWTINRFCYGNDNNDYWTTLPYYGYTHVTAQKLADMIRYDSDLNLHWVPSKVVDKIAWALQADHDSNHQPPKGPHETWDPYYDWKWRSKFMEERYAENGDLTRIMSNCWGNADYLTRSFDWAEAYPANKQYGLDNGMSQWAASFPHIYLDGWQYGNSHSIDGDLDDHHWRFHLEGTGNISGGLKYLINSFDVIRMADQPGSPSYGSATYELNWNTTNVGQNKHCAVYLCTDRSGKPWFYQKGNFGATAYAPYGIHAFGLDSTWQYENHFRSYFRHDGDYKKNLADAWEIDWKNVEP
jgi:hypothetical protein